MAGERTIIGIDPGIDGALARLWPLSRRLQIADMPTVSVTRSGKQRRVIDEYALAQLVDDWAPTAVCVWLEEVNAAHSIVGAGGMQRGMSANGSFAFGRSYGIVRGICAANFLPIRDVPPRLWKRALGATSDKNQTREVASGLYPGHAQHWALKKHDGRAEAVLIAHYGAGQQQQEAA